MQKGTGPDKHLSTYEPLLIPTTKGFSLLMRNEKILIQWRGPSDA